MLKKIIFYIVLFSLSLNQIISQNNKIYQLILISEIPAGKEDGELGYKPIMMNGVPYGLGFNENYNLYISDDGNNRLNIYNNDINFLTAINQKFVSTIRIFEFINNKVNKKGSNELFITFNSNWEIDIIINFDRMDLSKLFFALDYFIYYKNIIFNYSREHQLISIQNPTDDDEQNIKNFRNTEETRKLIKSQYKELTLDHKDRIILNGKILTRIFKDYIDYWDEVHKGQSPPKNFNKSYLDKAEDYFSRESSAVYYGKDKDGNWYWGSMLGVHPHVFIFDENGWIIEAFAIKESDKQVYKNMQIYPAIHPLGDVYYLDFDGKSNYLYMVPRTWGYDKITRGTCTENGISIRLRPSVKADILGKLNKDDEIEIVDKTDIKLQVEDAYNYWYKIKLSDGTMGWVFGDYVNE